MSIVDRPSKVQDAIKISLGKGLTVERIYTTAGVHPYDEVTWQHRDVCLLYTSPSPRD